MMTNVWRQSGKAPRRREFRNPSGQRRHGTRQCDGPQFLGRTVRTLRSVVGRPIAVRPIRTSGRRRSRRGVISGGAPSSAEKTGSKDSAAFTKPMTSNTLATTPKRTRWIGVMREGLVRNDATRTAGAILDRSHLGMRSHDVRTTRRRKRNRPSAGGWRLPQEGGVYFHVDTQYRQCFVHIPACRTLDIHQSGLLNTGYGPPMILANVPTLHANLGRQNPARVLPCFGRGRRAGGRGQLCKWARLERLDAAGRCCRPSRLAIIKPIIVYWH